MLEIRHLTKSYGDKVAVSDLSLSIAPGDIYGFIGHNGAGKTTTIKACCGILGFDAGEILIGGHSIKEEPMVCKKMLAYIPDEPALYEFLTGRQYLDFVADIYRIPKAKREEKIRGSAQAFEMQGALADTIDGYSHGMKQKLSIMAALLHEPKLMILDEPFVGLDPKAAHTVKQIMAQLCAEGGAIFFSTHVLEVAEKLCNKIAILKDGKLVVSGNTADVIGDASLEDVFLEEESDHV
ncbi:MAG: ABC transporter ATP-binding protein [Clostridia bacterium]|nr:ABC transporter ATP-binding protein [Clostridia bacterium]